MLIMIMVLAGGLAGWLLVTHHQRWGSLMMVVMLCCQGIILLDTQYHYGATVKPQTVTSKIAPVTQIKGNQVLVTKQVEQGKTAYTAYATREPQTQRLDLVLNRQKRVRLVTGVPAKQVAKVTRTWHYYYQKTSLKWLFAGVTTAGQKQRQTVTYQLSDQWQVLTRRQLTQLGKQLKQTATQAQLQAVVTKHVRQQIQAHPQLASQQAELVKQTEQIAVRQLIEKVRQD
ncbi:DUF4811 domain-containing protein [Lactiplantibacillus daoliensis]|uniref:DUF4811 domain-containing protein n=1 Tax=Lactiplantibacillus daoliensis TaxID=2559916 RepID=A0ABW1UGY6_9LACO|nr:DUF4811 domain-containing protein [Lactiplantibacillus daoliensis]